ncbi:hypothetical protein SAMD00019534_013830 [Acytostelium subglobosum LB1]|uniref:hypothetical protein n=1 Tax=Acytostelium subglobosum LB1 TaxID=1410327 RepID=UPI00064521C3|nr:hypothetical protein SAMD00019534_013830 [Acytostelium subglobosum LB1]GAM18208.1 hypothetical protein SAMD00019534_013830 [Acytostelium subglobosum LB1]|eukprot:XP_012758804.1 hypothetical protein SAMD00019534_013830 [Acytostelium subglobosum LB1]
MEYLDVPHIAISMSKQIPLVKMVGHSRPLFKKLKHLYTTQLRSRDHHYKQKHIIKHAARQDQEKHIEVNCPRLPQLIINKIVALALRYIPNWSPKWVSILARVSTHFHKACSLALTHLPMPSIHIRSPVKHIGSQFCLFKDTPLHLKATEIVHIPDKDIARCIDRLEQLTVPFYVKSQRFIHIKAPHLKHIRLVEKLGYNEDEDTLTLIYKIEEEEPYHDSANDGYGAYRDHLDICWMNQPPHDADIEYDVI